MTSAYNNFVKYYLEANTWHERKDGVPVELIDQLTTPEKEMAEEELINCLRVNDSWEAIGLGYMKSNKAAPKLYSLLTKARGSVKAEIATALWKICNDENMLKIVLNLSRPSFLSRISPFYVFRQINVIHCLAQFPQPEARMRLEELKTDREYLIS